MSTSWRLFLLVIALPCVPILSGAYFTYDAVKQAEDGHDWVSHTADVIEQIQTVKVGIRNGLGRQQLEGEIVVLARLVQDHPLQARRVSVVRGALFNDFAEMDLETKLALFDKLLEEERGVMLERRIQASSALQLARRLGLGIPLLSLIIFAFVIYAAVRRIREAMRSLISAARDISAGKMDRRAFDGNLPPGVVRDLAVQFNQMAAAMETRQNALAILSEMTGLLQACDTMDEAAKLIERFGHRLMPSVSGEVFTLAASRNQLRPVAAWGEAARTTSPLDPHDCWALRRGTPHVVIRPDDVCCDHVSGGPSTCIPLMAHGETLGLLVISGEPNDSSHRSKLLGEQLALTLANLRLRHSLEEQSLRDPLTGLYNRRYLEESFARELARCEREGLPLSVLMLDVDHFKSFNDAQGHEAGDAVLRTMGATMRNLFRESDIVCRYGGEEFCVVLPNCTADKAIERAEELRQRVAASSTSLRGERLPATTISVGVSTLNKHEGTDTLMRQADAALYEAKRQGRNRVHNQLSRPD